MLPLICFHTFKLYEVLYFQLPDPVQLHPQLQIGFQRHTSLPAGRQAKIARLSLWLYDAQARQFISILLQGKIILSRLRNSLPNKRSSKTFF